MLGGGGYYRGSSVLISGTAGTGKTSLASSFAGASCARGERCLFFSFEESPDQLIRNLRSIGLDLGRWRDSGLLRVHSSRPSRFGLETHLSLMHKEVQAYRPDVVVVDPISNFLGSGTSSDAESMLIRMIDFLKSQQITSVFTNLVSGSNDPEAEVVGISSIIDSWLLLRDIERDTERVGSLRILKSRGMWHSKQVRGFRLTARGIELPEPAAGDRSE
jgi:circadian clock protein KaiC